MRKWRALTITLGIAALSSGLALAIYIYGQDFFTVAGGSGGGFYSSGETYFLYFPAGLLIIGGVLAIAIFGFGKDSNK